MSGKYKLKASFTVEAAYVCPLMFLLIFSVLHMAFSLHDRLAVDAWSAAAAEEARMALQYGKIPYSEDIYKEGFNDNEGRQLLKLLATDRKGLDGICMSGPLLTVSTELKKNSLTVGVDIKGKEAIYLENRGERGNYAAYARLTTLVFRFGKKLLNV